MREHIWEVAQVLRNQGLLIVQVDEELQQITVQLPRLRE